MKSAIQSGAQNKTGLKIQPFSMKATSHFFKILSSSLYEDKPLAVLRELTANALDAHTDAEILTKPILLSLPNSLSPELVIQDFGAGMSLETLEHVYTSYGSSTKTDSNDVIGGFGLGSKSPFALTQSFIVESINKGQKTHIACYLDEGIPKFSVISCTKTKESSGTIVRVPIADEDVMKELVTIAGNLFALWDTPPKISGAQVQNPKADRKFIEYDDVCIYTDGQAVPCVQEYKDTRAMLHRVAIGPFIYAVPQKLQEKLTSVITELQSLEYHNIFDTWDDYSAPCIRILPKFRIGELELAPSRERIEITLANENVIKNRLDNLYQRLVQDPEDHLKSNRDLYLDLIKQIGQFADTMAVFPSKVNDITYFGLDITKIPAFLAAIAPKNFDSVQRSVLLNTVLAPGYPQEWLYAQARANNTIALVQYRKVLIHCHESITTDIADIAWDKLDDSPDPDYATECAVYRCLQKNKLLFGSPLSTRYGTIRGIALNRFLHPVTDYLLGQRFVDALDRTFSLTANKNGELKQSSFSGRNSHIPYIKTILNDGGDFLILKGSKTRQRSSSICKLIQNKYLTDGNPTSCLIIYVRDEEPTITQKDLQAIQAKYFPTSSANTHYIFDIEIDELWAKHKDELTPVRKKPIQRYYGQGSIGENFRPGRSKITTFYINDLYETDKIINKSTKLVCIVAGPSSYIGTAPPFYQGIPLSITDIALIRFYKTSELGLKRFKGLLAQLEVQGTPYYIQTDSMQWQAIHSAMNKHCLDFLFPKYKALLKDYVKWIMFNTICEQPSNATLTTNGTQNFLASMGISYNKKRMFISRAISGATTDHVGSFDKLFGDYSDNCWVRDIIRTICSEADAILDSLAIKALIRGVYASKYTGIPHQKLFTTEQHKKILTTYKYLVNRMEELYDTAYSNVSSINDSTD